MSQSKGARGGGSRGRGGKGRTPKSITKSITQDFYKCGNCEEEVGDEEASIECHECRLWFHRGCTDLNETEFKLLTKGKESIVWKCLSCLQTKGDETKKFIQLENKLGLLMEMIQGIEGKVLDKIESIVSKEVEQQVAKMEERIKAKIEKGNEEKNEKEKRKNNIILVNVPENSKKEAAEAAKEDIETVKTLLRKITNVEDDDIVSTMRINNKSYTKENRDKKPRVLKIVLKDESKKRELFKNARKINDDETNPQKRIYLNNDLTPEERNKERELRTELKRLKESGKENIKIDYRLGKIISTDSDATQRDGRQEANAN